MHNTVRYNLISFCLMMDDVMNKDVSIMRRTISASRIGDKKKQSLEIQLNMDWLSRLLKISARPFFQSLSESAAMKLRSEDVDFPTEIKEYYTIAFSLESNSFGCFSRRASLNTRATSNKRLFNRCKTYWCPQVRECK